jgi:integrase
VEGQLWEASLRLQWQSTEGPTLRKKQLRGEYERLLSEGGSYEGHGYYDEEDPIIGGFDYEIDKLALEVRDNGELSPLLEAKLAGLQDARKDARGLPVEPRRELEPSFSETAERFMKWWKAQPGLKQGNTEQQKRATYRLFAGYWRDRPIRNVRERHASEFMDILRHLDPLYARSPAARRMGWDKLLGEFGGCDRGLSPATLNRHAATLKALWDWSVRRGLCEGLNPFDGHRQRLRRGVNVKGYEPWETEELCKLLDPAPKRRDLHEVILVAMHSGMRLNEVAALTWGDLREREDTRSP